MVHHLKKPEQFHNCRIMDFLKQNFIGIGGPNFNESFEHLIIKLAKSTSTM